MAVAAAIAGALVLEPNFFDELGLFTNEMKNRISAAPFEPTNNFARTFASIPNTVATKESDQGASALAMDQLKRHATAFALVNDDFSQGDTDSHATVSSRKLDPQEAAVDVQGSPRAIDQLLARNKIGHSDSELWTTSHVLQHSDNSRNTADQSHRQREQCKPIRH